MGLWVKDTVWQDATVSSSAPVGVGEKQRDTGCRVRDAMRVYCQWHGPQFSPCVQKSRLRSLSAEPRRTFVLISGGRDWLRRDRWRRLGARETAFMLSSFLCVSVSPWMWQRTHVRAHARTHTRFKVYYWAPCVLIMALVNSFPHKQERAGAQSMSRLRWWGWARVSEMRMDGAFPCVSCIHVFDSHYSSSPSTCQLNWSVTTSSSCAPLALHPDRSLLLGDKYSK